MWLKLYMCIHHLSMQHVEALRSHVPVKGHMQYNIAVPHPAADHLWLNPPFALMLSFALRHALSCQQCPSVVDCQTSNHHHQQGTIRIQKTTVPRPICAPRQFILRLISTLAAWN